ncbi:division/cell wall cluster transcriptional repressor MraZ [candidate division KSB1 bacterium]|nr:division/cell wall cluster transcriptional repressor MraZ [bacterium]RKY74332.1 MAG: division/cell wall cluster transcriptional repressor MraZ [candidate division KSB1 bacterium]RKY77469.1 MAG: division/cell wall cluster transcriptional repressor MraZ [candidate division KSB1 bacterium]RKY81961.1 MAG: division/cell wall cluster transcriptional repressor MraZ [candidate division KSB1 bacterium]RKY92814.1 MAG: division/cell wall cluster transcriptional repressor MraZ [candidate division KSB1 b
MPHLYGRATTTVDDKGRMSIPAKFRNAIHEEYRGTLYLTIGHDECIYAYPLDGWEQKFGDYEPNRYEEDENTRWKIRQYQDMLDVVQVDKQGRIYLPSHLVKYAKIEKEVLILGTIDKLEFWNPQRFAAELEKYLQKKQTE